MKIFNFLMAGKIFAEDTELHTDGVLDLEGKIKKMNPMR